MAKWKSSGSESKGNWQQGPISCVFCLPVKVISLGLFQYQEGRDCAMTRLLPVFILRANLSLLSQETDRSTLTPLPDLHRVKVGTFCFLVFISCVLLENNSAVLRTSFFFVNKTSDNIKEHTGLLDKKYLTSELFWRSASTIC